MHRRHRGFTLVELLVVLAIMAILLALLFPAVLSARSSALDAKCKNQVRQVGLALAAYHDQHLALPPGWIGDPAEGGTGWGWAHFLFGDGAVHFVTAGIEAEIFRALATRSGGEIASVAE